jgi:hypothetical protein
MDKSMKFKELFSNSFQQLRASFQATEQLLQPMPEKMFSTESRFCLEAVAAGLMSQEGMQRAAQRYLLGRNRSNETVFWMIDDRQRVRDGMVGDTWASVLLKERGVIDRQWCPQHCLFGQHLLGHTETICVVESVRSCVVLSERFTKYLWMATGYLANLNEWLFLPLKGHHIVCFPATDPTGDTYLLWLSVAKEARKYGIDIRVSRLLEDQASPTQKEQCVDLVDFVFGTQISQKSQI